MNAQRRSLMTSRLLKSLMFTVAIWWIDSVIHFIAFVDQTMWFIVQTWLFLKATKFVKNGNNLKMRRFDEKKTQYFFKKKLQYRDIRRGIRLDEKNFTRLQKRKKLVIKTESSLKVRLFNFHMVSFLNVFFVYSLPNENSFFKMDFSIFWLNI